VKLVALVLAAGSATRFGGDKLATSFRGQPLVHHALRAALAAPVTKVIVVCPARLDLADLPVETVRIASVALSDSLRAGIAAAGDADGVFVFLGDMPLIPHDLAARLVAALGENFAAVPRHAGKNGHPVLLAARAFPDIARLSGDEGAGRLLKQRADVAYIDVGAETILLDVDRAEDLARLDAFKADRS
jgi:molybdenum cofactor cytidylyltransferase